MGSLFGGGTKTAAPPKPVSPAPTPEQLDQDVKRRDLDRRRQRIAAAGRQGTILTQGQPLAGTSTILGRTS